MNKNCKIISDLLPLYLENMVSADTKEAVEKHIESCQNCQEKLEDLRKIKNSDKIESSNNVDIKPLKKAKKRMRNKIIITSILVAICSIFISYKVLEKRVLPTYLRNFYTKEERSVLFHYPTKNEKNIAEKVISEAKMAFDDIEHTKEESEKLYGVLSKYTYYVVDKSLNQSGYADTEIELLGVKIEDNEGYIWVNYSWCLYDKNDNLLSASTNIDTLWKIKRNSVNKWEVVDIKEHP